MALQRLVLIKYACFTERTELELAPITVLFGRNHSGKSALARSLRVLETGFGTNAAVPLDLAALGDDAPEFIDLVPDRLSHGRVAVEFGFEEADVSATIQSVVDEGAAQVVSDWRLLSDHTDLRLRWDFEQQASQGLRTYLVSEGDRPPRSAAIAFRGLTPEGTGLPFEIQLPKYPSVRMMGPFRSPMARRTRLSSVAPALDPEGRQTATILINDHARGSGEVIGLVNDYLEKQLADWRLEVRPQYDGYSVRLRSVINRNLSVAATDSGTGVTQLLPLLVLRAQDEVAPPMSEVIEVVEEPELHLHPAAQSALADMYIDAAQAQANLRFLVETHSETLLLRLRRRVAEGTFDPARLALYYIENDGRRSTARRVVVDDRGDVNWWPDGIFSEDFAEVRQIALAQRNRLENDAH
ncbi:AAA family ATPase [Glycomyces sp. MUSA5-2]|uniref:AAA family ATPase n=1 Tax=Glycomyces sp. MUSA5-2 TaxID=2053002 RepID=UPI0030090A23